MRETEAVEVLHLRCTACQTNPSVAMIDGSEHLVCHCTHVDGEIEPTELHGFEPLPERWSWFEPGGDDA